MMGSVPISALRHEASPFGVKLIDPQTITVNLTSTLIFLFLGAPTKKQHWKLVLFYTRVIINDDHELRYSIMN